jgi:metallophosphoesterase (TIGR00282 family)
MLTLLFIGDVFGSPGRRCLNELCPKLRERFSPDVVVANGENAAGGLGLSAKLAGEMFVSGVDVITSGNHAWKHKDLIPLMEKEPRLLRPANYPPEAPGAGYVVLQAAGTEVAVVNLEGRIFMSPLDCPFRLMDELLAGPLAGIKNICVDFHAEATSEKQAFAWHVDGRVSAVIGTHTHVQTADERILPQGTAFITDLGLTGPHESVIGMDPQTAVERIISQRPLRFKVGKKDLRLQGALVKIDQPTGKAQSIERLSLSL